MLFLAIRDQGAFEEGVSCAWVFLKEGGDFEVAINVELRLLASHAVRGEEEDCFFPLLWRKTRVPVIVFQEILLCLLIVRALRRSSAILNFTSAILFLLR